MFFLMMTKRKEKVKIEKEKEGKRKKTFWSPFLLNFHLEFSNKNTSSSSKFYLNIVH